MNRIVLIGNGFDIANGLDTRYSDFIKWLYEKLNSQYNDHIKTENSKYVVNGFIEYNPLTEPKKIDPIDIIPKGSSFDSASGTNILCNCNFTNQLFKTITTNYINKKWVDIEADYFEALKSCIDGKYSGGIAQLNKDLKVIEEKLKEFLNSEKVKAPTNLELEDLHNNFFVEDLTNHGKEVIRKKYFSHNSPDFNDRINRWQKFGSNTFDSEIYPETTLFLNFNYTDLPKKIVTKITDIRVHSHEGEWTKKEFQVINIHGELDNSANPMIFGYGDEQDDSHRRIEQEGLEYLSNIKTINYLKTNNYKKLLSFIESGFYQIFIFGHSCGLSDKTLLNTLFKHNHCVSIKPFYYEWTEDGQQHDNYDDIVKNIYRIFSNKGSMRDKVVPKTQCKNLTQNSNNQK